MADTKASHVNSITEGDYCLPDLKEPKAFGTPTINKPAYSFNIVRKGHVQSFQYYHLESGSTFTIEGEEHHICLRFDKTGIAIRGRNLWRLYDYIMQHRMPWVAMADNDLAEDRESIITGIEVTAERSEAEA